MKMGPNLIVNTVVMSMITMMIMITQMSISIIAASNNNSIAAANSTTTCWCSDLLYKPDFGCQNGSSSILLEYPNDAGIIQCSGAYTLKQTKPIPSLKVLTANASKLYTVIMVDTSDSDFHPFMHYGAVNVPGETLINGINLDNILPQGNVFFPYNGPSPPQLLRLFRIYRRQLFLYELVIGEQINATRTLPEVGGNFQVNFTPFLDGTTNLISTNFNSGFCVKRKTSFWSNFCN